VTALAAEAPAAAGVAPVSGKIRNADASHPPASHATFLRETSLEDAVAYRLWRLAQPCPDCGTDPAANRCVDHLGDLDLVVAYHQVLRTAARESRSAPSERHDGPG
jgi:hypothetical protein